jgi:hypothetical protein
VRRELNRMLRRRGLEPVKKEIPKDIRYFRHLTAPGRRRFYEQLKRYSFRLVLRDVIRHPGGFTASGLTRFCAADRIVDHLNELRRLKILRVTGRTYRLASGPVGSFGDTLEWFLERMLRDEFGAEVISGVRFRGSASGGDYDLIASIEGELVYVESKSSPPRNIELNEVVAFLNRIDDLIPHLAFFFVDTQLRMKDKIVVLFEQALRAGRGRTARRRFPVQRLRNELFHVRHRLYLLNSKRDVVSNFRACFRDHWRHRIWDPAADPV